MAQTREEAANATAQSLFTKNDPTNIKNEPELSAISQKFIYNDINKQIKLNTAKQELLTLVVLTANNTPEDIPAHVGRRRTKSRRNAEANTRKHLPVHALRWSAKGKGSIRTRWPSYGNAQNQALRSCRNNYRSNTPRSRPRRTARHLRRREH